MKSLIITIVALALTSIGLAQERKPLNELKDKVSYSIGLDIGTTFKKQKVDINPEILLDGMKDALSGAKPRLTDEQLKETMTTFSQELRQKQEVATKEAGQKNTAAGEKFLAENKTKPGVKTTASGLQYKVIKEGGGPSPKESDTVVTNYRGTLINGTEFDSSYKRNQPATFQVTRVIKGWTEGLQLMKVGSKYQFVVPANLAYGERSVSEDIGPNETLIFEVELLEIKPAATAVATPSPPTPSQPTQPGAAAAPTPAVSPSPKPKTSP
jgi:FKBP-type peptidyl-prolyl cis-trans isomerase FklB